MGIRKFRPYTPSRRHMTSSTFEEITKASPEKSLLVTLKKNSGRNNQGKSQYVTVEAALQLNTESSTSNVIKMVFQQE